MKVELEQQQDIKELEIRIRYKEKDQQFERLLAFVQAADQTIIGHQEDKTFVLRPDAILYFESVDDRVVAYTDKDTYTIKQRLYEIETMFPKPLFVRVAISFVLNVTKIAHFSSSINGRIEAELTNGDKILISRAYVPQLKEALGGRLK